jgi:hypothetical protein
MPSSTFVSRSSPYPTTISHALEFRCRGATRCAPIARMSDTPRRGMRSSSVLFFRKGSFSCGPPHAVPQPQKNTDQRSRTSIQQRVPPRRSTARHKRLMVFIECRISRGHSQRGKCPCPSPAFAAAAKAAEQQKVENSILRDVSGLAKALIEQVNLVRCDCRIQPS